METLTQGTTKKITDDAIKTFGPVIEQMANEGCDTDQIVRAFQGHVKIKTREFYRRPDFAPLNDLVKTVIEGPRDSKAEGILLSLLTNNGIGCVFHRKIGPYTADYLVNEKVIIELDGPEHQKISQGKRDTKRDSYLKRMGYEVIRIPLWALSVDTDAIIEEIRAASITEKPKRKKRKAA
ncbi:MAG: DUF559 domain-containing protein [Planctomycetes bacterium]|nr:DUF559 domain-containing protein [Planctomycetota bacterium]